MRNFEVGEGRGGKDFTPAHRKTDSRFDGGNSLHHLPREDAISRPGRPISNTRAAASSWQHDLRSASAEPGFADWRDEDDGDDDDDVSGGEWN